MVLYFGPRLRRRIWCRYNSDASTQDDKSRVTELLQAFDHVEVRQRADVAVDVSFAVGRQFNATNCVDSRRVARNQLLPRLALPCVDVDLEDARRNFAESVNEQEL